MTKNNPPISQVVDTLKQPAPNHWVIIEGPPAARSRLAADLARQLGINLHQVVSKFIGETEKNLMRVLTSSHPGDAILFFDEAESLFGKRTGVKDAHDRFAGIESARGIFFLGVDRAGDLADSITSRARVVCAHA